MQYFKKVSMSCHVLKCDAYLVCFSYCPPVWLCSIHLVWQEATMVIFKWPFPHQSWNFLDSWKLAQSRMEEIFWSSVHHGGWPRVPPWPVSIESTQRHQLPTFKPHWGWRPDAYPVWNGSQMPSRDVLALSDAILELQDEWSTIPVHLATEHHKVPISRNPSMLGEPGHLVDLITPPASPSKLGHQPQPPPFNWENPATHHQTPRLWKPNFLI